MDRKMKERAKKKKGSKRVLTKSARMRLGGLLQTLSKVSQHRARDVVPNYAALEEQKGDSNELEKKKSEASGPEAS